MPTGEVKRRIIVVSPGILFGGDTALNPEHQRAQLFQLFSRHERNMQLFDKWDNKIKQSGASIAGHPGCIFGIINVRASTLKVH